MSNATNMMIESKTAAARPPKAQLTRRIAMALGLSWLFAPRANAANAGDAATRPAQRAADANAAFMRGDMTTWYATIGPIPDDYTLMQPFGGAVSRGFNASPARLEELSRYFRNGETQQELIATYASDDLVVLVLIERQHAEVGGLPDQDWSLRVTQVFRRRGEAWEQVHRHADPLVRHIGLERASTLVGE